MTESVSKEFAQSKDSLLPHGLPGLTGKLSCLWFGLLQHFSEANGQPSDGMVSCYVVTAPCKCNLISLLPPLLGCWALCAGPASCTHTQHPSRVPWIWCHPYVCRVEPLLLPSGIHPQGGFECSPHPIFCWHCDLSFLRHTILCDFDFQMNNGNEEHKKKKIHFIFSVNKIHFVLLSPSSPLLWAFTDSRNCYWVLVGNSSSLFTVSAGDIIASHSLNSWIFFLFVCLFPTPTFLLASIF